jgi:hypothetical protein
MNLSNTNVVIDKAYLSLINIFKKYPSISTIYKPSSLFEIKTNDERLLNKGNILCYVSIKQSKDRKKYLKDFEIDKDKMFWKVITSEANGENPCFGAIFIGTPEQIYTQSYISFQVKNKKEATSLESYLKCKLPNYLLSLRKITQHIAIETCKWIPLVPLDRIWDDKHIFNYFNMTPNQIKIIETSGVIWKSGLD